MADKQDDKKRGPSTPSSRKSSGSKRNKTTDAGPREVGQTPGDGGRGPEYPTGTADVDGTPGGVRPPLGEVGGSGIRGEDTRTRRDVGSDEGIETGAGLSPHATVRSDERDTGASPGSTDTSKVTDMGPTGMEGPSGGTAGITGVSGSTGVVGRPPGFPGDAGVADTTGGSGGRSAESGPTGISGDQTRRARRDDPEEEM